MKCDFCGCLDPKWTYLAESFTFSIMDSKDMKVIDSLKSEGGWDTCDECATLIDAGKEVELVERTAKAMQTALNISEDQMDELMEMIAAFHIGFWRTKQPKVPVNPFAEMEEVEA